MIKQRFLDLFIVLGILFTLTIIATALSKEPLTEEEQKQVLRKATHPQYKLGYVDGWMDYALDEQALARFEIGVEDKNEELGGEGVPQSWQDEIWYECVEEAEQMKKAFDLLSDETKFTWYEDSKIKPFWSSDNGTPRTGLFYLPRDEKANSLKPIPSTPDEDLAPIP